MRIIDNGAFGDLMKTILNITLDYEYWPLILKYWLLCADTRLLCACTTDCYQEAYQQKIKDSWQISILIITNKLQILQIIQ